jgi:hypothetical protein
MHPLAHAQELLETTPGWTPAEKRRIAAFKIPGDYDGSRFDYHYSARAKRWRSDHAAKLAQLERAEGL